MGGRAVIIFADGSKQMAHNLDDLRFRWYERKVMDFDEWYEQMVSGMCIPTPSEDMDLDGLKKIRATLDAQKSQLSYTMEVMKSRKMPFAMRRKIIATVKLIQKEILAQQHACKVLIVPLDAKRQAEDDKLFISKLKTQNKELRSLLGGLNRKNRMTRYKLNVSGNPVIVWVDGDETSTNSVIETLSWFEPHEEPLSDIDAA